MPTDWMPGYEKKLAEKRNVDALVEFTLADRTGCVVATSTAGNSDGGEGWRGVSLQQTPIRHEPISRDRPA